jgi:hypothetical protein
MRASIAAAIIFALLSGFATTASAVDISGRWSGFGKATFASTGKSENFRCRVTYTRQSAKVYAVNAVCANPSTRVIQTGMILQVRGNTFVGDFHNAQFDVRGRVRVTVSGNRQSVTMSSSEGRGVLTLSRR